MAAFIGIYSLFSNVILLPTVKDNAANLFGSLVSFTPPTCFWAHVENGSFNLVLPPFSATMVSSSIRPAAFFTLTKRRLLHANDHTLYFSMQGVRQATLL